MHLEAARFPGRWQWQHRVASRRGTPSTKELGFAHVTDLEHEAPREDMLQELCPLVAVVVDEGRRCAPPRGAGRWPLRIADRDQETISYGVRVFSTLPAGRKREEPAPQAGQSDDLRCQLGHQSFCGQCWPGRRSPLGRYAWCILASWESHFLSGHQPCLLGSLSQRRMIALLFPPGIWFQTSHLPDHPLAVFSDTGSQEGALRHTVVQSADIDLDDLCRLKSCVLRVLRKGGPLWHL